MPSGSKKVSDSFVRDLTSSPWAGLKVTMMLFATDALGQKGRSAVQTFLLPERVFNDPTARALILLRKQLTRDPKALRSDVVDGMTLIGNNPKIASSLFSPGYSIAAVLANEFSEATGNLYLSALIELGLVLFLLTFVLNGLARLLILITTARGSGVLPT